MDGQVSQTILHELTSGSKVKRKSSIIALMTVEILNNPNDYVGVDDFVVRPYDDRELVAEPGDFYKRMLRTRKCSAVATWSLTWLIARYELKGK